MVRLPQTLPLLDWPEVSEQALLREERADLMRRIAALRPHAHRRIVLEARLAAVTAQLLTVEQRLAEGAARHGLRL
jgi:hypothetical protein